MGSKTFDKNRNILDLMCLIFCSPASLLCLSAQTNKLAADQNNWTLFGEGWHDCAIRMQLDGSKREKERSGFAAADPNMAANE